MGKASEGGGPGVIIGDLAYRADNELAIGREKLLRRTAGEKNASSCHPLRLRQLRHQFLKAITRSTDALITPPRRPICAARYLRAAKRLFHFSKAAMPVTLPILSIKDVFRTQALNGLDAIFPHEPSITEAGVDFLTATSAKEHRVGVSFRPSALSQFVRETTLR